MPSWAVINYFMEIELDRAGDVKAAGVRYLHQRHQIALDMDSQNVQLGLAGKPFGCALWMLVDENSMECSSYLFFGSGPGEPLPPIADFKVAKHARANKTGKSERPKVHEVRRSCFRTLTGIPHLYKTLFGTSSHTASQRGQGAQLGATHR